MRYGLLGERLSHSFSKEIHESLGKYKYELIEVAREDLDEFMEKKEFDGLNVTIPYKELVMPYLDHISTNAKAIGAVNTIINKDGKLYGYNTDYYGLKDLIEKAHIIIKNKTVLILGTGGTKKTADRVVRELGAKKIYIASRKTTTQYVSYKDIYNYQDVNVIINTTPKEMYPTIYDQILDINKFQNLTAVVDVIYNPLHTNICLDAKARGITYCNGLFMLVSQAAYAYDLFTDEVLDVRAIERLFIQMFKKKENICLIGMPSCGKTTLGKMISEKLGREFYDIDTLIEQRVGMKIYDYFKHHTEDEFRIVERKIIREVSLKQGCVISTGGGVITNEDNIKALKHNSKLFFIDRSLKNLIASDTRPLSSTRDKLEELYNKRLPLYKKYADKIIDGDLSLDEKVELIGGYYEATNREWS